MTVEQHQNWYAGVMDSEVGGDDNDAVDPDLVVDSIDRKLVSLRIQNETDDVGGDGSADTYTYQPVCLLFSNCNLIKTRSEI